MCGRKRLGKGRFALINHKDKIQDRCEECKKKWQKERDRLNHIEYLKRLKK